MNETSLGIARGRVPNDDNIETMLNNGQYYAEAETPKAEQEWLELLPTLEPIALYNQKRIELPLNLTFYFLGFPESFYPEYIIMPDVSGELIVTMDTKGSFVPDLSIENDTATQTYLGDDIYEIRVKVEAGQLYTVQFNKNINAVGLYSIVARMKKNNVTPAHVCEGTLITTGAALRDGNVYVWGFRGSSQQGNGKMVVACDSPPAKVNSLSNIVALTAGAYHLLALDEEGNVYGWGQSGYGETGCTPTQGIYVSTPGKVLVNVTQIAAGEYFSIALDKNGQVWTWGHNLYGQLGNGGNKNSRTPVAVNLNGEKARLIGAAYEGAFAVTEEGHVWAWGDNEASGLGFKGPNYGVQQIIRTPTRVTNLDAYADRISYIAGGNGWGEALLDDGTVIGWGLHASLGQGTTKTNISSPYPVQIMTNVKQLFARYVGSVALTEDGKIYTWGQTGGSAFPMVYGAGVTLRNKTHNPVVAIGGGKEHIFYRTENGKIYGIGYNDLYKLNQSKLGAPSPDWPGSEIYIP